jgi:hypothetical protein
MVFRQRFLLDGKGQGEDSTAGINRGVKKLEAWRFVPLHRERATRLVLVVHQTESTGRNGCATRFDSSRTLRQGRRLLLDVGEKVLEIVDGDAVNLSGHSGIERLG